MNIFSLHRFQVYVRRKSNIFNVLTPKKEARNIFETQRKIHNVNECFITTLG